MPRAEELIWLRTLQVIMSLSKAIWGELGAHGSLSNFKLGAQQRPITQAKFINDGEESTLVC